MAAPLPGDLNAASKRSRSGDSPAPLGSTSSSYISRTQTLDDAKIPAFLRQSKAEIFTKFRELNWQEKIRIAQGRSDPESRWAQDGSLHIHQRNRYVGVQPWDKSRIRLRVAEGASDYINASPILLQDPRTEVETLYIATQGPKKNVLSHFWQMVRHETGDNAVIVMLTPTEESGREKCFQYFPLDAETSPFKIRASGHENDSIEGEVSFIELVANTGPNTTVRKLHLTFGEVTKVIWHLLFTAFPDFGVPEDEDRAELLELLKLSEEKNSSPKNPKIIHCSAGVGRSGTFIALEYLLSQLGSGAVEDAKDGEDMVQEVVHRLREQRMMMVQMENQFQFLYDVLREELERKLLASLVSGQPSPKLRKLASGIKASTIAEPNIDKPFLPNYEGEDKKEELTVNEETKSSKDSPKNEGQDPNK